MLETSGKLYAGCILLAALNGASCKHKEIPNDAPATGVAECDAYVVRYEACVDKMPDEARAQIAPSIEAQRATYRAQAKSEGGRALLASTCKASLEALKDCP